jgi:plastocyanin
MFSTIAVAGQSDVVADSSTDTLTLVAGTGITITTNASTDTLTFSAASGSSTFNSLTDVTSAGITVDRIAYPAITMLQTTNSGSSAYLFNNQYSGNNPTLYALSGTTIAFNLNVVGHPFLIQTSGGTNYDIGLIHVSTTGTVSTGSSAQGQVSGTLYWQIPIGTTGNYRYICSIHGAMVGTITIKDFTTI